jgi:hypothetical protein
MAEKVEDTRRVEDMAMDIDAARDRDDVITGSVAEGSDTFVDGQVGVQCALHAARNVTKGVPDEALTLEAFEIAHKSLKGVPESYEEQGGFSCTVLVKAFSASKQHNCFEIASYSTKATIRDLCVSVGNHLCGIVLHKPGHWYTIRRARHGFDEVDSLGNAGAGSITAVSFEEGIERCWKGALGGHRVMLIYKNMALDEWKECKKQALQKPATYVQLEDNLWHEPKDNRPQRDPCECTVACVAGECLSFGSCLECEPETCRWREECGNQRVQRREFVKTHVEKVGLRGLGLFTSTRVVAGAVVAVYLGEVCRRRDAKKRAKVSGGEYILEMKAPLGPYFIDAEALGTKMRYVNHSCDPNSQWRVWEVARHPVLVCESLRCLELNEEVTVDYGGDYWIRPGPRNVAGFQCLCGCESCRFKPTIVDISSDSDEEVDEAVRAFMNTCVTLFRLWAPWDRKPSTNPGNPRNPRSQTRFDHCHQAPPIVTMR